MTGQTLTLRELFEVDPDQLSARFGSGVDVNHVAESAKQEIAKEASMIRWPWVRDAVAEKSRDLLNLNIVDILVDSWKKYMDLCQYADHKKYGSEEEILTPLASHTLKSEHHPYLQILLKEREVSRVTFELDFSLILDGFVLKIRDGKILEILTGSGTGEGKLSLENVSLWDQQLKPVHLPGSIPLGDGISLRGASAQAQ